MDSKEQAGTAPERIWLQHGADDPSEMTAEEWKSGEVSWCWENIHGNDVEYIRADLARPAPAEGLPEAEPLDLDWASLKRFMESIVNGESGIKDTAGQWLEYIEHMERTKPAPNPSNSSNSSPRNPSVTQVAAGGRECWVEWWRGRPVSALPGNIEPTPDGGTQWVRMVEVVEPPPALPREALEDAEKVMRASFEKDCGRLACRFMSGRADKEFCVFHSRLFHCIERVRATLKGENHHG